MDKFCATAFGYNALFVLLTSSDLAAFLVSPRMKKEATRRQVRDGGCACTGELRC
jgi:hypothetical protein